MQTRRHALPGRKRVQAGRPVPGLRQPAGIYARDHADPAASGRLRWLSTTCLAAVAGLSAILFGVLASGDVQESPQGRPTRADGPGWAVVKADKLLSPSDAIAITSVIAEPVPRRQGDREIILEKRYLRLVARLAPIGKGQAEAVPHLDPIALYAPPDDAGGERERLATTRVIELLDGTLPNEDGQHLALAEIAELVAGIQAAGSEDADAAVRFVASEASVLPTVGELGAEALSRLLREGQAANVSTLDKSVFEAQPDAPSSPSDLEPSATSLHASLHHAASRQGLGDAAILRILRIHAFQTDFGQRVRVGDALELFLEEDNRAPGNFGALLATAITSKGETRKFYRFRAADGTLDYYDAQGSAARTFLMRRPVSCRDLRLTSGFGPRRHPMLLFERMHLGEDWACAPGTPIMASGNGVIEAAGPKGELGKHVRIQHANGYKTAYGHMSRFAPGIAPGAEVRQGQVIGYVGMSGLSSGAHVHYEVLVKTRADGSFTPIDPTSIQVPRERQLVGKELADFRKERDRIDRLMRRPPISTRVVKAATEPL